MLIRIADNDNNDNENNHTNENYKDNDCGYEDSNNDNNNDDDNNDYIILTSFFIIISIIKVKYQIPRLVNTHTDDAITLIGYPPACEATGEATGWRRDVPVSPSVSMKSDEVPSGFPRRVLKTLMAAGHTQEPVTPSQHMLQEV